MEFLHNLNLCHCRQRQITAQTYYARLCYINVIANETGIQSRMLGFHYVECVEYILRYMRISFKYSVSMSGAYIQEKLLLDSQSNLHSHICNLLFQK